MKFRTEIAIHCLEKQIDHTSKIFTLGSCFAENIAERLDGAKFAVTHNPTGILFNPASIAAAIGRFAEGRKFTDKDIIENCGHFFSLDAHTSLDGRNMNEALKNLNNAVAKGYAALSVADTVIITFGTAWVYTHNNSNKIVANCHKLPSQQFRREQLTYDKIIAQYRPILTDILRDKQVIFTISPVRHIADGLDGNAVSKATLRLAVESLCKEFDNVSYFPAYEIMLDDLRDYRFYANDLIHPSTQAVDYIWEKFSAFAFSVKTINLLPKISEITQAAAHRPFDATSEEYRTFCRRMISAIEALPEINFSKECEFFNSFL